nr:DUF89 family protein [Desulfobacterales bacterium]
MRTYLDCIPCFFKQALFASRIATDDEEKIKEVLNRIGMLLPDIPLTNSPPETGRVVYGVVREVTGIDDPFRDLKNESIKKALKLYPSLKTMVNASDDRLETAIKIAVAGNIIDFGASPNFELEKEVEVVLKKEPVINHFRSFRERLNRTEHILYLADNAGETVFDRVLIEELSKPVTYVVRERPVINDALIEDAVKSGIDKVADVITSGCDAPGTILERCSKEFCNYFENADLIISKGQGNYETLSNEKRPIFYMLRAKCPVVARNLGVKQGDIVLKSGLQAA